jgi:hypothetical protein
VRRLISATLAAGLLAVSGCAGGTPTTRPASPERSVEVAGVTVAATPERIDATGAVLRLKLDTHTTPLDMDLPAAAHLSVAGRDWPARTWTGPGPGGHHREGTLEFAATGPGDGPVRLVVDGLGKPAELTWTEVSR